MSSQPKLEATAASGTWLHGASGRMGQEIKRVADAAPAARRLLAGSDRRFSVWSEVFADLRSEPLSSTTLGRAISRDQVRLVLDFSTVEGNALLLEAAAAKDGAWRGKAVLIGTTGLSAAVLQQWRELALHQQMRLLIAPNTSIGILLTAKAALLAAAPLSRLGFDIEIVETHHRLKKDAPSGTARFLADTIAAGVGDLSVNTARSGARTSGELGVHAVRGGGVFGEHEVRIIGDHEEVTISHRAFSRTLFAQGALVLGAWIAAQPAGVYGLMDIELDDLGMSQPAP